MGRVLLTVWPFPTHVRPNLALAVALRKAGHEVRFYTGEGARPLVEAAGFAIEGFQSVDEPTVRETVARLIDGRRNPWGARRRWREFLVETVPGQIADLEGILRRWGPDAIVCDLAMWGPLLVLGERDGVPIAVLSHVAHCLLPGPEGPVTGWALPRQRGAGMELVARGVRIASRLVTDGARRGASRVRAHYGLAPLDVPVSAHAGRMPLYLVPSVPELDHHRRDLPPSVHYVGPCLWPPPPRPADGPRHRRPLVLVEEGALYERRPVLLDRAAAALGERDLDVVLLPGEGRDTRALEARRWPERVRLERAASFRDLLPEASAVVTNGNSESVLAALCAGVPLVVVPSLWDQAEMAWQVAETGVGLRLPAHRSSRARLWDAVEAVLNRPSFALRARQMARVLLRAGGPPRAAALVARLLSTEAGEAETLSCTGSGSGAWLGF